MTTSGNDRQTVLVTGASSGIGLEVAREAAAEGNDVVLVARSADKLEKLAAELRAAHGVTVRIVAKDLGAPGAPAEIVGELDRAGVRIDVLVNNAGIGTWGRFADSDPREELAELQLNVVALTHLTRLVLAGMVARRHGRILNVASTAAFQPGPLMATYYASKAYVLSFSEALDHELAGTGVRVTTLCPGPTTSGFQARARMQNARLVSGGVLGMMDAATVARAGWRGMKRGKRMVIPGLMNWMVAESVRFAPRRMATAIAASLNASKS